MTILHIETAYGDDYYRIDADESQVECAVEDLEEEYDDQTPEDEWDEYEKVQYVLDGLENKGFDPWNVDIVHRQY